MHGRGEAERGTEVRRKCGPLNGIGRAPIRRGRAKQGRERQRHSLERRCCGKAEISVAGAIQREAPPGTEKNRKEDKNMKTMKIRITFTEALLGSSPANAEIYRDFIGSKAPDAASLEDEVEALGAQAVAEKGMTVFPKTEEGTPFLYDYQIKGFFKDACSMLSRLGKGKAPVNASGKLKAYKKIIDGLIFVAPRRIILTAPEEIGICERPLRAQTMQGERVALVSSEELPAGTTAELEIVLFDEEHEAAVREWLDYGALRGIGQWRNSGKGRFEWKEIEG